MSKKLFNCYNIEWNVANSKDLRNLPKNVDIEVDIPKGFNYKEESEAVELALSTKYCCILRKFTYEEINN